MFCGFADALSSPRYCPPPLLDSVPRSAPVEVTNTRSVALLLVLVASTRNTRFELSYSARVRRTVSVLGGCGGAVAVLIVSVALRVTPPNVPLIVALVVAFTAEVLIAKAAVVAPAATVTLAGTRAAALLLASVTTVAEGAAALNVTIPCAVFPPTTEAGDNVNDESVTGAGAGVPRVTVTDTSRRPSRALLILMLTVCVDVTVRAVAVNATLEAPAGMTTVEGTGSAVVLLLDTENEKPPAGATAPAVKLILISVDAPEAIVEGVAVTLP